MPAEPPAPAGAPEPMPIPPDLLAWAKQTFDENEYLKGIREIEAVGGHTRESFIGEVEAQVRGPASL